jgi:uncharacterized protein YggE
MINNMMTENQNEKHTYEHCGGHEGHWGGHGYMRRKVGAGFILLAVTGSLFLLALFATTLKQYNYIGRDVNSQTTITVTGDGEAYATPDIANISFAITQEAKTAAEARKTVDDKMKNIHAFLNKSGVADKDIKAAYSLYPKFEWQEKQIVCVAYPCVQPPGKQVLTGYEVSESVDVKIRDIDKNADAAGTIVGGLADNGATNISGPNFALENEDGVKSAAREEAIAKAKAKADKLAQDLGVTLVRIASFNEGNNYPMFYGGMAMKAMSADSGAAAPEAANIPAGQNKYTSNVTIVYEIR